MSSSDPKPVHVYGAVSSDVKVTLTVSDGQADGSDNATLVSVPPLKPGRLGPYGGTRSLTPVQTSAPREPLTSKELTAATR